MLLVGNHQTFALDLGLMVEQIVRERGFLPRGLAHPAIFGVRCRTTLDTPLIITPTCLEHPKPTLKSAAERTSPMDKLCCHLCIFAILLASQVFALGRTKKRLNDYGFLLSLRQELFN